MPLYKIHLKFTKWLVNFRLKKLKTGKKKKNARIFFLIMKKILPKNLQTSAIYFKGSLQIILLQANISLEYTWTANKIKLKILIINLCIAQWPTQIHSPTESCLFGNASSPLAMITDVKNILRNIAAFKIIFVLTQMRDHLFALLKDAEKPFLS